MVAAILSWRWGLWHRLSVTTVPAAVFLVAYLVTSVIGATVIRLWPSFAGLVMMSRGIDPRRAPHPEAWLYWTILYLPLVVIPVVVRLSGSARSSLSEHPSPPAPGIALGKRLPRPGVFAVIFAALASYCVVTMVANGFSPWISNAGDLAGDYGRVIAQRTAMMATLGPRFYGFLYGGMPALSFIALYMALVTRRRIWWALTIGAGATIAWLSVATLQKSIILVYLVVLGIGGQLAGRVRARALVWWGAGLLLLFTGLQWFFVGPWGVGQSAGQVVLRMAVGYPYYLGLFPDPFPFYGVDWQGVLLGTHLTIPTPDYNLLVSNLMWSGGAVQGAVPAPAVVSAYAEGGVVYSIVVCLVIAVVLALAGRLGRRGLEGPYRFAFFLALIQTAYYLTQVPLLGAFWQSYGLKWGVVGIGLFAAANWMVRGPTVRSVVPANSRETL